MAKKQKYYVVWDGVNPGIYDSWTDCQAQIKGYPNAKYKSFPSKEIAEEAFYGSDYEDNIRSQQRRVIDPVLFYDEIEKDSMAVDAACSGNPGIMEYRGVWTVDRVELFKMGPFKNSTNNIGEFLALVHALAFLKKLGKTKTTIYSDSRTGISWVRNKKVKTQLQKNKANKDSFELIDRGIKWLKGSKYENPIVKWDTERWGEIPADFGRK